MGQLKRTRIDVLGTGTSTGVPVISCKCPICTSTDPKNARLRSSILITTPNNKKILIDTSPDLRTQLLRADILDIDSTIITHDHADHVHGIDDLRPYCFIHKKHIPLYTSDFTAKSLKKRFDYIFNPAKKIYGGGIPRLSLKLIQLKQETIIDGEKFTFYLNPHGNTQTLCFINRTFGYLTDCESVTDEVISFFKKAKLDLLIIDCLKEKHYPNDTHLHIDETLHYVDKIAPKTAKLIHMAHDFGHDELTDKIQKMSNAKDISPLYDTEVLYY